MAIYSNHVVITIPHAQQESATRKVFTKLKSYVDTVHVTAGYFVYAPQSGDVFNPSTKELRSIANYSRVGNDVMAIGELTINEQKKKPWWKVW